MPFESTTWVCSDFPEVDVASDVVEIDPNEVERSCYPFSRVDHLCEILGRRDQFSRRVQVLRGYGLPIRRIDVASVVTEPIDIHLDDLRLSIHDEKLVVERGSFGFELLLDEKHPARL